MIHPNRTFQIKRFANPEDLAEKMTGPYAWTLCTGFELVTDRISVILLNDALSEDGAQEYAVLRPEGDLWRQFDSFTVSWMTAQRLAVMLRTIMAGQATEYRYPTHPLKLDRDEHRCRLCA